MIVHLRVSALQSSAQYPEPADARRRAKELEKHIHDTALARVEYDDLCANTINDLNEGPVVHAEHEDEESADEEALPHTTISIGRYTNATHHRDGLFSFVYKARNVTSTANEIEKLSPSTGFVALKVTTPSMMEEPHDSEREARILRGFQCDKIVPLIDSFQLSGGRLVLVFPFFPYTLEEALQRDRVTHAQARLHLKDLFSALEFLHEAGVIHRDVKPSNVLLKSPEGPAYLADFGIAWSHDDIASEDADDKITDVGTTSYRPPELLFGNTSYNCTLDMWAAGCVAAEVTSLTTKSLFQSGDLGSELSLIKSIFESLGTPTLETWPEAATFRDWGKMQFYEYPIKSWKELLPRALDDARDLVGKLVRYESSQRLTASEALRHQYFVG